MNTEKLDTTIVYLTEVHGDKPHPVKPAGHAHATTSRRMLRGCAAVLVAIAAAAGVVGATATTASATTTGATDCNHGFQYHNSLLLSTRLDPAKPPAWYKAVYVYLYKRNPNNGLYYYTGQVRGAYTYNGAWSAYNLDFQVNLYGSGNYIVLEQDIFPNGNQYVFYQNNYRNQLFGSSSVWATSQCTTDF
jgi:hypothetical protein